MDVDVLVAGVPISLSDGVLCYFMGEEGLGGIPVHRLTERGPLQHGDTDRGFRFDPRYFRLILEIVGSSWTDLWTKRNTLIGLFIPTDEFVTIRFNTLSKQIDCYYVDNLDMSSADRSGYAQLAVIGLKASDPTFYDPNQTNLSIGGVGGTGSGFVVPMPVPTEVGESDIDETTAVNNEGNVITYPILTAYGPLTNLVITNLETNEKLDFTGYTLADTNILEIDCRYGYKTVEVNGVNEIDELTDDSDLSTFHLEKGVNSFNVTASGADSGSNVFIRFYKRYGGI